MLNAQESGEHEEGLPPSYKGGVPQDFLKILIASKCDFLVPLVTIFY